MRLDHRSALTVALVLGTAVATALPSRAANGSPVPVAQSAAPAPHDSFSAERAALMGQLSAGAAADPQIQALEVQLETVQAELNAAQERLAALNARLLRLSQQIADDRQTIQADRSALASLLRATYVLQGSDDFASYLLSSGDVGRAYDRLQGAERLSTDMRARLRELADRQHSMAQAEAEIVRARAEAEALDTQLGHEGNRLMALVAQRNIALSTAPPATVQVVTQLENLGKPSAPAPTPRRPAPPAPVAAPPVQSSGPCGNHFSFGQCTWYVASRRCIPWSGNAYDWWFAARSYGYAEGSVPAAGAVVVWYPGGGGAGPVGHVAYVEAVGPAPGVPAGYFKLSEMNYSGGWDVVGTRVTPNNSPGIAGFIY